MQCWSKGNHIRLIGSTLTGGIFVCAGIVFWIKILVSIWCFGVNYDSGVSDMFYRGDVIEMVKLY